MTLTANIEPKPTPDSGLRFSRRVHVHPANENGPGFQVRREEAGAILASGHADVVRMVGSTVLEIQLRESFKQPESVKPEVKRVNYASVGLSCAATLARRTHTRQHLLQTSAGTHTPAEWAAIIERSGNTCLCCGVSGVHVPLTKDHITPLSTGGTNYASNLQPLCMKCNRAKGTREVDYRGRLAFAS